MVWKPLKMSMAPRLQQSQTPTSSARGVAIHPHDEEVYYAAIRAVLPLSRGPAHAALLPIVTRTANELFVGTPWALFWHGHYTPENTTTQAGGSITFPMAHVVEDYAKASALNCVLVHTVPTLVDAACNIATTCNTCTERGRCYGFEGRQVAVSTPVVCVPARLFPQTVSGNIHHDVTFTGIHLTTTTVRGPHWSLLQSHQHWTTYKEPF